MKRLTNLILIVFTFLGCSHEAEIPSITSQDMEIDNLESFEISSFEVATNSLRAIFSTSNFVYNFNVDLSDGKYYSSFTVNSKTDEPPLVIDYDLDPSISQWELDQEEKVLSASYRLTQASEGRLSSFPEHISAIDSFLNNVSVKSDSKSKLSLLAYHMSVLNVSKRQFSEDKGCTVYPFFLVGRSLFRCQEDVSYSRENVEKALLLIAENTIEDSEGIDAVLKRTKYNRIPFKDLYRSTNSKVHFKKFIQLQKAKRAFIKALAPVDNRLDNITFATSDYDNLPFFTLASGCNCSGPCGSSLGCCGNYGGCCILWSNLCLIHDLECLKCDKWHCGWACKPEVEDLPDEPDVPEEPTPELPEPPEDAVDI